MIFIKEQKKIKYFNKIEQIDGLSEQERTRLANITDKYRFYANDYYLSLIDWDDPTDPIRKLIIPDERETEEWGSFDPSGEINYTVLPGVEHKYASTVLFLVSNVCGGICRYCFRKRVFISKHGDILSDLPRAIQYVKEHDEITNVLLTGGDPLMLSTHKLETIINALLPIEHVKILRIGTKMPAFNPYRIIQDDKLLGLIGRCHKNGKQVYIMNHFIHPKELTNVAIDAVKTLHSAGAVLTNQMPMIRGINDNVNILAELFRQLSFIGLSPYYVFQCRPASGNKHLSVPIEEGYDIFNQACSQVSGLAKRARFVISHLTGKIEVVGVNNGFVYLKYHRTSEETPDGKFMVLKSNPNAYWLDDYQEIVNHTKKRNYYSYGPE